MSLTGSRCLWTRAFPLWDFRTASCLLDFQPSLLATAKCFRPHCVCGHENHRNDHGGQPHVSFLITLGQSSPTCVQIQTPDTLSDIVFFLIEIIFKNLEFNKNPHFWFLSKKKVWNPRAPSDLRGWSRGARSLGRLSPHQSLLRPWPPWPPQTLRLDSVSFHCSCPPPLWLPPLTSSGLMVGWGEFTLKLTCHSLRTQCLIRAPHMSKQRSLLPTHTLL